MNAEVASPRVISNSEINSWRNCQRQYYYSYDLKIEPIDGRKGRALMIGNIGHWTKKRYFQHLLENPGDFDGAKHIAMLWLAMYVADGNYDIIEYGNLVTRKLHTYFDYFPQIHPGAQVLEVEQFHQVDLIDEFSYGFTNDLRLQDGPIIYLIDHKWTHDFWGQIELDTKGAAQLDKYFWAMQILDIPVDRVAIWEYRYRERGVGPKARSAPYTNEEQFRETDWVPTVPAMRNLMIEQVKTSREIVNHRSLETIEEKSQDVIRNIGTNACKFCDFATLCLAELNGEPIIEDIDTNFQPKTYDYNETKDTVVVKEGAVNDRDY